MKQISIYFVIAWVNHSPSLLSISIDSCLAVDLEDEQKRAHHESRQLNVDLQRITKDLDHETIARIELENRKQSLEDEIHFLKQVHAEEIEELKQLNMVGLSLDPTKFFRNELSNAVQHIREEYEELNQQQRTELQSWYQLKVTQAVRFFSSKDKRLTGFC